MRFTKMQGIGNDFVIIERSDEISDYGMIAKELCNRHYGIGADGVIILTPSKTADVRMQIYNADGTEAEMCGNGIRCVGKYIYEKKNIKKFHPTIETKAGIKNLTLHVNGEVVDQIVVDMGCPILYPKEIPVEFKGKDVISQQLILANSVVYPVTCVSMGNPHAVIFGDDIHTIDIESVGRAVEKDQHFPNGTNVEFAVCENRRNITMRVWERGVGETEACGTGACAVVVASILNHLTDDEVFVKLKGGELFIRWDRWKNIVFLAGSAETVFEGEIKI